MGTAEATSKRRWRPRFSLLTLILCVIFVGACFGLWWRWEPWVCEGLLGPHESMVRFSEFAPDDRRALTFCAPLIGKVRPTSFGGERDSAVVRVWDLDDICKPPLRIEWGYWFESGWREDGFSADGRWVISRFGEAHLSRARIFDAYSGRDVFAPDDEVLDVCFGADGKEFYAVYANKPGEAWDALRGVKLRDLSIPPVRDIRRPHSSSGRERSEECLLCLSATFSPDAKWVAIGDYEFELPDGQGTAWPFLWNVQRGEKVELPAAELPRGCFSPDGRRVLVYRKHSVTVYDLEPLRAVGTLQGRLPMRTGFSPDGSEIVTLSDCKIHLWDAESAQRITTFDFHHNVDRYVELRWIGDSLFVNPAPFTIYPVIQINLKTRDARDYPTEWQFINSTATRVVCSKDLTIREFHSDAVLAHLTDDNVGCSVAWSHNDRRIITGGEREYATLFGQRRPEATSGIAWLPEFWVALVSGGALVVIATRRLRRKSSVTK